jgi:sugar-specific transcriptional regulator TrmB
MSNMEDIKILEKLGLTEVQSKVYLANYYIGPATAKQISKSARTAREDIYRVMPALQKLGLIRRHIIKPAVFEAIPPKEAISFLINRRKKETEEISKQAHKLISACERKTNNGFSRNNSEETILLSCTETTFRRLVSQHKATDRTIDIAMNWETHKQEMEKLVGLVNSTIDRGVTIRSIMNSPNEDFLRLPRHVQQLFNNPSYKIRFLPNPPPCRVAVFDNEVGFIVPSSVDNASEVPFSLWTTNPVLVSLLREYLEKLWSTAQTIPYPKLIENLKKEYAIV